MPRVDFDEESLKLGSGSSPVPIDYLWRYSLSRSICQGNHGILEAAVGTADELKGYGIGFRIMVAKIRDQTHIQFPLR